VSLTRRQAIAAVAAAPLLLAADASADDARHAQAVAALTQSLELEQTAVVAYEAIANSGRLGLRPTALFRQFRAQDGVHAQQLVMGLQQLGAKTTIPPRRAAIPGLAQVRDERSAVAFAVVLEQRTIAAYLAAVPALTDVNVRRTSVGAMGTDAQQLVVLRQLAHENPVPTPFERGSHR